MTPFEIVMAGEGLAALWMLWELLAPEPGAGKLPAVPAKGAAK